MSSTRTLALSLLTLYLLAGWGAAQAPVDASADTTATEEAADDAESTPEPQVAFLISDCTQAVAVAGDLITGMDPLVRAPEELRMDPKDPDAKLSCGWWDPVTQRSFTIELSRSANANADHMDAMGSAGYTVVDVPAVTRNNGGVAYQKLDENGQTHFNYQVHLPGTLVMLVWQMSDKGTGKSGTLDATRSEKIVNQLVAL
ncbi:hypothetical protein [Stenotrophomonas sp. PS02289]|uniref:hypothetical protein n=1 Tax=Stenotrophomonas sp. PS02289 TaxID=2991422 RepID=UPI00249B2B60|nr:hypothetical protein [Stenotrophomonas sp. PS02289]